MKISNNNRNSNSGPLQVKNIGPCVCILYLLYPGIYTVARATTMTSSPHNRIRPTSTPFAGQHSIIIHIEDTAQILNSHTPIEQPRCPLLVVAQAITPQASQPFPLGPRPESPSPLRQPQHRKKPKPSSPLPPSSQRNRRMKSQNPSRYRLSLQSHRNPTLRSSRSGHRQRRKPNSHWERTMRKL